MPGPLPPDRAGTIPLVLPPPTPNNNIVTDDCKANFFDDLLAINRPGGWRAMTTTSLRKGNIPLVVLVGWGGGTHKHFSWLFNLDLINDILIEYLFLNGIVITVTLIVCFLFRHCRTRPM